MALETLKDIKEVNGFTVTHSDIAKGASRMVESLPEVKFFRKCQKCGATDWGACNLDKDNRVVTDCDKCPDKPKGWSPLN